MANNSSVMQGIKNSWSLISFAKAHGIMSIGDCTNHESNKPFKACTFTSPIDGTRTFVGFSSRLGELTPQEVAERKDNLQVVELMSGNFKLCEKGESTWETVDLGI